MSEMELKHPYSGIALPCEVWADPGRHDWYFREKKPDSVARFIREDCTPDPAQIRADAIREAAGVLNAQYKRALELSDKDLCHDGKSYAAAAYGWSEQAILALIATPLSPTAEALAQQISSYHATWSAVLKPTLLKDGDMWCALYGDNLQVGIAGFGPTPALALIAFETAMCAENGSHIIERKEARK